MKAIALCAAGLGLGLMPSGVAQTQPSLFSHLSDSVSAPQQLAFASPEPGGVPMVFSAVSISTNPAVALTLAPGAPKPQEPPLPDGASKKLRPQAAPEALKPGVYETKPYTMIVVVPGSHPDDKCIWPKQEGFNMPVKRPDLQFIPRNVPGPSPEKLPEPKRK